MNHLLKKLNNKEVLLKFSRYEKNPIITILSESNIFQIEDSEYFFTTLNLLQKINNVVKENFNFIIFPSILITTKKYYTFVFVKINNDNLKVISCCDIEIYDKEIRIIWNMCTANKYKNLGYGTKLLKELKKNELNDLYLYTENTKDLYQNKREKFYRKLYFIKIENNIDNNLICSPNSINVNEYSLWKLERFEKNNEITRMNILLKQMILIIKSTYLSKGAKNVLHSVFENHLLAKCLRNNNPIWAGNLKLIYDKSHIESCVYWLFPLFTNNENDKIL